MSDAQWHAFFVACNAILGRGHHLMERSESWCSWTTFRRLTESDAGYWTAGLPNPEDVADSYIGDGGVWGQPFSFAELAHVIIPHNFVTTEGIAKLQDIDRLSQELSKHGVPHRLLPQLLEVKVY